MPHITKQDALDFTKLPANRSDFEQMFPLFRFYHNFHDNIMRSVRSLAERGLLKRKKREWYTITKEGRKALRDYYKRWSD